MLSSFTIAGAAARVVRALIVYRTPLLYRCGAGYVVKFTYLRSVCVSFHADDSQSLERVLTLLSIIHATTHRYIKTNTEYFVPNPSDCSPSSRSSCLIILRPYEHMITVIVAVYTGIIVLTPTHLTPMHPCA